MAHIEMKCMAVMAQGWWGNGGARLYGLRLYMKQYIISTKTKAMDYWSNMDELQK